MAFCKEYNAATQDKVGTVIPVEITCYEVRFFAKLLGAHAWAGPHDLRHSSSQPALAGACGG